MVLKRFAEEAHSEGKPGNGATVRSNLSANLMEALLVAPAIRIPQPLASSLVREGFAPESVLMRPVGKWVEFAVPGLALLQFVGFVRPPVAGAVLDQPAYPGMTFH